MELLLSWDEYLSQNGKIIPMQDLIFVAFLVDGPPPQLLMFTVLSSDVHYGTDLLGYGWFVVSFQKLKKKLNKDEFSFNGYFPLIYGAVLVIISVRIIPTGISVLCFVQKTFEGCPFLWHICWANS